MKYILFLVKFYIYCNIYVTETLVHFTEIYDFIYDNLVRFYIYCNMYITKILVHFTETYDNLMAIDTMSEED